MQSTTLTPMFAAATTADTATKAPEKAKSAVWTRLYNTLIEARQAQAKAIVARHMAHHDDATLLAIGWSEADIADLRRRIGKA